MRDPSKIQNRNEFHQSERERTFPIFHGGIQTGQVQSRRGAFGAQEAEGRSLPAGQEIADAIGDGVGAKVRNAEEALGGRGPSMPRPALRTRSTQSNSSPTNAGSSRLQRGLPSG
jgi:hypothetical protein